MENKSRFNFSILLKFILLLFTSLIGLQSFAQKEDVSKYLDDGGISSSKNIVKINLSSTAMGDASVSFERVLANAFSLEAGVGKIMPYYVEGSFWEVIQNGYSNKSFSGYSFTINPRFYKSKEAPEFGYVGIHLRRRNIDYGDFSNNQITDLTINSGKQIILGKRIAFDIDSGIGLRTSLRTDNLGSYSSRGIVFQLNIKTGFLF